MFIVLVIVVEIYQLLVVQPVPAGQKHVDALYKERYINIKLGYYTCKRKVVSITYII
jgi:hypothetical protein